MKTKYFSYFSTPWQAALMSIHNIMFLWRNKKKNQGPVVQSVVSLMSSLRAILLTILADSIYNFLELFAEKM